MPAYFRRLDATRFAATDAVQGAWNTDEQHIAPALGLLTHALERDRHERQSSPLTMSRISFDILGTLPIDTIDVTTRVIRAGRTIELAEATLHHAGRPASIARAWFAQNHDTAAIAGTNLPGLLAADTMQAWSPSHIWPGRFVTTVDVRRNEVEPGRAQFWMRPRFPLLEGETISPTARMLGLVDIANGITPRVAPAEAYFPNVDLDVHLFRAPESVWIGFDTTVSFGPGGHGLTHSLLHDEHGPIGALLQALTVRPRSTT
ncbi:thioesterase family protein [Microbacterium allomyrinae]|uniref:Thioesterase family protein n=1 Tax=Microbacterium allomyrinae TaxID=2830666 RepID=A0A9X1LWA8_9MICO|nr:thioesterase family protein [Microbacterium allomyrinae]MCC2033047.1 thioesterase family protein [Microbacterium allomyrinae]